nr:hypothetical protein Iba_chr05fCG6510 [Ipomoea batatas]GME17536.1 hypothetical protein Iba_scaffold18920CG0480 [Ipomoea batatas]
MPWTILFEGLSFRNIILLRHKGCDLLSLSHCFCRTLFLNLSFKVSKSSIPCFRLGMYVLPGLLQKSLLLIPLFLLGSVFLMPYFLRCLGGTCAIPGAFGCRKTVALSDSFWFALIHDHSTPTQILLFMLWGKRK